MATVKFPSIVLAGAVCLLSASQTARGDLPWTAGRKESMRLRLVALAWNHPRSSFFGSEEVFVAEKELTKEETRLVKLVYEFLPYQPRLSDEGLDYSTLHELRAMRDPQCDETLLQIASGQMGDWRQQQFQLKYSTDAPPLNLSRHRSRLPCYVTTAEDYAKPIHDESQPQVPPPPPTLNPRPN
jgi:hypothetical protein